MPERLRQIPPSIVGRPRHSRSVVAWRPGACSNSQFRKIQLNSIGRWNPCRTAKPYSSFGRARANPIFFAPTFSASGLTRLLGTRSEAPSRSLTLRGTVERIEYQFTGSRLAAQFLLLESAKKHLGPGYRNEIRLRLPPYVKLILSNQFPRTQSPQPTLRSRACLYTSVPFTNRSTAARFESEFLDLFQLRRCPGGFGTPSRPSGLRPAARWGGACGLVSRLWE